MARIYPERVTAKMTRLNYQGEILLLRQKTRLMFGSSNIIIGTVIMTNPGSFDFKNSDGWIDFKSGKGTTDIFVADDFADLTMQNIIEVVRQGHRLANKSRPNGIVEIYNISNIVQSKGEKAEEYHNRVQRLLDSSSQIDVALLNEPVTNVKKEFINKCQSSPFIIMGFVDKVFTVNVLNLIKWSQDFSNKIVFAKDSKGRYSHPRRWRTENLLKEKAISMLKDILIKES